MRATRDPSVGRQRARARSIEYGASPRASIALAAAARAHAFLDGRGYALPGRCESQVAPDVLRHRIMPTYEAEADGIEQPIKLVDPSSSTGWSMP